MRSKRSRKYYFAGAFVFVFSLGTILLTLTGRFEHYGDMGTSATGVAIARSYYNNLATEFKDPPGYLYNGEYAIYGNWPAIGFIVLSKWFELFGNDDILTARLLPSLLYALCALAFFILLIRCKLDLSVCFLSSLLFAVLPYHLEFGKLIFSDMWLLPFWLSCLLIYTGRNKYHWLILPISIVGAFGFMWFAIFTIPAWMILFFFKKQNHPFLSKIKWLIGLILVLLVVQWLLFHSYETSYPLLQLKKWTFFGFDYSGKDIEKVVKRPVTLLYESLPILFVLALIQRRIGLRKIWNKTCKEEVLIKMLSLCGLTLFCLVIFLPNWVFTHSYGVGFFSVLIAGIGALLLQNIKSQLEWSSNLIGLLMILCSIGLNLIYPFFSKGYRNEASVSNEIIDVISKDELISNVRPIVFFHLPKNGNLVWPHGLQFGIKEDTRSYIFNNDSLESVQQLSNYFDTGIKRLSAKGIHDFDLKHCYFISDRISQLDNVQVLDTKDFGDLYLFRIAL